jgi:hypothetical protein
VSRPFPAFGFASSLKSEKVNFTPFGFAGLWAANLAGEAQRWNGHGAEKAEIKSAQMFGEILLGQRLGENPGRASMPRAGDGKFLTIPACGNGVLSTQAGRLCHYKMP